MLFGFNLNDLFIFPFQDQAARKSTSSSAALSIWRVSLSRLFHGYLQQDITPS